MMKILLFCRYPQLGKVKSRLAIKCGEHNALLFYKKMMDTILTNLAPLNESLQIHYTGCTQQQARKQWPYQKQLLPQVDGSLGTKLTEALKASFTQSAAPLVFIGSDCPFLEADLFEDVEKELKRADVVIGPAQDGGYYLIAMSAPHEILFQDIEWGSDKVCRQTMKIADENNLSVVLLEEKNDMDRWEDIPDEWKKEIMRTVS